MPVRKPLEKKVGALIDNGAKVKADRKEWTVINLRLPTSMLNEIDEVVSQSVGISRTGWILQAIHKELNE